MVILSLYFGRFWHLWCSWAHQKENFAYDGDFEFNISVLAFSKLKNNTFIPCNQLSVINEIMQEVIVLFSLFLAP